MPDESGVLALVVDKWDSKFEDKTGETLVEYAGRGVGFPDDYMEPAEGSYVGTYVGTYTYKPDGSWTGTGSGIETFEDGTTYYIWKESSSGTQGTYTYKGGTGKYKGARGGGSYTLYEGVSGGYLPGTLQRCKYTDGIK